jgi:entericidin B
MKRSLMRIGCWMLIMLGVWTMAACNTMEGAGEDIEEGGEAIQDAAD